MELYSPQILGDWEIRQENDGRLIVCQVGFFSDNISVKPSIVVVEKTSVITAALKYEDD